MDNPEMNVRNLRPNLAAVINAAERDGTVTTVTRGGKQVAAIIPLFMLEKLEEWEDAELSRRADEALANDDAAQRISLTQMMSEVLDEPNGLGAA